MKITLKHGLIFALAFFVINVVIAAATKEQTIEAMGEVNPSTSSYLLSLLINLLLVVPIVLSFREWRREAPKSEYSFSETFKFSHQTGAYGALFSIPLHYLNMKFINHDLIELGRIATLNKLAETNSSEKVEAAAQSINITISPGSSALGTGVFYYLIFIIISLISSLIISSMRFNVPPTNFDLE